MKAIIYFALFSILTSCTHNIISQSVPTEVRQPTSENPYNIDWQRFELPEAMPRFGKFSGQNVENAQRRAIIFLTTQEKINLGLPTNQIAFANFRHAKTFYIATIPGVLVDDQNNIVGTGNIVDKIVFSEKRWAAKIRKATKNVEVHSELSLFFKPGQGIKLILNQDKKIKLEIPQILFESMVYSVEAARSQDDPQASFFPYALGPNFAISNRIESNTERNIQHREDPDRKIVSRRLDFTGIHSRMTNISNPKDAVLVTALLKSHRDQRSQAYDVVTNNCTNGLFKVLDEALIYNNDEIDVVKIKKAVSKFARTDLKDILKYLKQQKLNAESMGSALNPEIDKAINEFSVYLTEELEKTNVDSHFLITMPPFVLGHLRGRGLVK